MTGYSQLNRRLICSVSKMIFKLCLPIFFLFVTIISATEEVKYDEPFSIENVWRKSAGCSCRKPPTWIKGVQKYYEDILIAFGSFPSEVSNQADLVKTTLQTLMGKAVVYSNSKSKILSRGATKILTAWSKVRLDDQTAQGVINEFYRVLPTLMTAYRRAVTDLKNVIGSELVYAVNKAMTDAQCAFNKYVEEFNGNVVKKEVDYEPVLKRIQTLTNTVALMGEVTLTKCQLATPEVQDALIVINLALDHILICVHGLSSSSEAVLLEQKCVPPVVLHVCSTTVGVCMSKFAESFAVNAENVPVHLRNVVNLTSNLNASLKEHFGMVNDLSLTVEKITQQLSKSARGSKSGLVGLLLPIGKS